MPLEWKHGKNPYRSNYFNVLKIGPQATSAQIVQKARQLCQELKAGIRIQLDDVHLDEHMANEASNKLRDPSVKGEEILLTHAPALKDRRRLKSLIAKLEELANLPPDFPELVLSHPLAVLWFLPAPGPNAAELPAWEEFGLGQAGDEEDSALDIVFDQ